MPDEYFKPSSGGSFSHSSGDCPIHGPNVPHWQHHERHRENKPKGKWCVECTLLAQCCPVGEQ